MKHKRVCILADSHGLYDDRIYWKQALSLRRSGWDVRILLIGDSHDSGKTHEGIPFQVIPRRKYFKSRLLNYFYKLLLFKGEYRAMLQRAGDLEADVYHFHDLRINRIGKKLKELPHKPAVIYDVHEPFSENIIDYRKVPAMLEPLKRIYAAYVDRWEKRQAAKYDFIITTEENVRDRFRKYLPGGRVEIIYNYTDLHKERSDIPFEQRKFDYIYCGGITEYRGALQILRAASIASGIRKDLKILFLGRVFSAELRTKMNDYIRDNHLEGCVTIHEPVPYSDVPSFYNQSKAGLGIFLPGPTHRIILQIKIFEYMCFGLPIIGSHFGHIASYIEKDNAGITVDPGDPEEIAEAMIRLMSDRELYERLSENGMKAADEKYRWEFMEQKLIDIYEQLYKNRNTA